MKVVDVQHRVDTNEEVRELTLWWGRRVLFKLVWTSSRGGVW